ncbi:MAG TPA: hypothetical protein PL059_12005 [Spirochaetota bacterium]|nr:hypothetical protein [Spirochaetota bacterium]HOM10961.1 hypothetical protein [Spirochaetota bacterium]HPP50639.1 hypothetical protein [Spirochaetota bacterium]HXK65201.1 hypothetical protein [Spirochaetota bacterium]
MRKGTQLVVIMAIVTVISFFAVPIAAEAPSGSFIIAHLGYVPIAATGYDFSAIDSENGWNPNFVVLEHKSQGAALNIEYNFNTNPLLFSFGFEYQLLWDKFSVFQDIGGGVYETIKLKTYLNQYMMPSVTIKYLTASGFYMGTGIALKYLAVTEKVKPDNGYDFSLEFDKKLDFWSITIVGYIISINQGLYLDVQGRFGYNLTNNQFSSLKTNSPGGDMKAYLMPRTMYDAAILVGVGMNM